VWYTFVNTTPNLPHKSMDRSTCHPDTYQQIFFRLAGSLRRFVYYKSGQWEQAEDIVQEAFLRLWKNCSEVAPDKAKSYLYTIAGNLFLDGARRQQVALKFKDFAEKRGETTSAGADVALEDRELQQRLENALAALPEGQREVFLMNRVEKLTYAEIAERLGLSVKAIEKRMHLALISLRQLTTDL
jgi:RNA polymerase sigma-70 factor (family 1)